MSQINWGIIGCGEVAEVKSGPGFQKATHSELVAVMRRNAERAKDFAQRHNVRKWYDDANALIHDPDVNAIYIATPPSSHKKYTLLAAAAGKPVYVEKPMALNATEAKDMVDACAAANVKLYAAYYRRALPRFLYIKEKIENGFIGQVKSVSTTLHKKALKNRNDFSDPPWRLMPAISGGGLFVDLASHVLDFLDFVLGPIQSVAGYAGNQSKLSEAEDIVSATFLFASGVHGIGLWNFNSFTQYDQTEIVGDHGKISFSIFNDAPVKITTLEEVTEKHIINPPHVQQPMIQSVVNDLLGMGKCSSTGVSGLRTSRIMDQILSSYYGNIKTGDDAYTHAKDERPKDKPTQSGTYH